MNRAALFTEITRRNALRREARLPRLDIRAEYDHAVAVAQWREIASKHYERVRAGVVAERLKERGPGSCESAGARWLVETETARRLEALYDHARYASAAP